MESVNNRELKCKAAVETILKEAKKQALSEFRSFPSLIQIELQNTIEDEITILTRLVNIEFGKYDKILNVRETKKLKLHLLHFFIRTKEVYDKEMKFQQEGYDAQLLRLKRQFLTVKKIDYLKERIDAIKDTQIPVTIEKLRFLGRPCDFAVLINALVDNKYIAPPLPKKGKAENFKRQLAILCHSLFHIPDLKGTGETSVDNLYEEFKKPSSNEDTDFFKIGRTNRNIK